MQKTGKIEMPPFVDPMYAMRLYETVKLYNETIDKLKEEDNVNNELIECTIDATRDTLKIYNYYFNNFMIKSIAGNSSNKESELFCWIDENIKICFNKILGEDYDV